MAGPSYFVVHLGPGSRRLAPHVHYEIQILDSAGLGVSVVQFGDDTEPFLVEDSSRHVTPVQLAQQGADLQIEDRLIVRAVLEAAKRQLEGKGDYVDENGAHVPPF